VVRQISSVATGYLAAPADFLVGDELQRDRIGQPPGHLPEDLGGHQRRDLHVLGAAGEQAVAVAARPELLRRRRHDVQVSVEDDAEILPLPGGGQQRAGLAARVEPLYRAGLPDEIEHEIERSPQLTGPVVGRGDGQQLAGSGQERLHVHAVTGPRRSAGAPRRER